MIHELIIPLSWEHLEDLLSHLDDRLLAGQTPAILRLRAKMITEELFFELLSAEGAKTARLRCTYPAPKTVLLQYLNEKGPILPELTVLSRLLESASAYGIRAQFADGSCTLTIGAR